MLQDVLAGRPTEIAFLNGELLRRAESLGLSMPNNRMLVAALDATARRPGS
jgi:2-dehydropantoate 2-reductase